MFGMMHGTHVAKPTGLLASQWESSTRFTGNTAGNPGPLTVRVEKESAPGSGVWSAFGTGSASGTSFSVDIVGYTEAGSYRVRLERQGVASEWAPVSTPDPFINPPAAPAGVDFRDLGGGAYGGTVTPSETFCTTRYQFRDGGGAVLSDNTFVSDGVPSAEIILAGGVAGGSLRARHERFSGTGSWASAWVEDSTP